jgi:hypothetical protein
MPNYQGVWSLSEQYQAIGSQNWPMAPGAPTGVSASAGDAQATVSFTAPSFTGVPPGVTQYRAISDPGGVTQTGSASPITVTGLSNGTSYTFSVQATNGVQFGPAGTSGSVTPAVPRALWAGGFVLGVAALDTIEYVNPSTTGNATDFGDLTVARIPGATCSSTTRGIVAGGNVSGNPVNTIDYFTISSPGNAIDFGDVSVTNGVGDTGGASNSTRGLIFGGNTTTGVVNVIQYLTIAATGNTTDFGDMSTPIQENRAVASPTRAVSGFDSGGAGVGSNIMEYVAIATTGNTTDFGDLTVSRRSGASCSSETRGLFFGGSGAANVKVNVIDYITIASAGNAIDFGDMINATWYSGGTSSTTRGLVAGGDTGSGTNTIQYVTIASAGNATDFGDLLSVNARAVSGISNAHGGLG